MHFTKRLGMYVQKIIKMTGLDLINVKRQYTFTFFLNFVEIAVYLSILWSVECYTNFRYAVEDYRINEHKTEVRYCSANKW